MKRFLHFSLAALAIAISHAGCSKSSPPATAAAPPHHEHTAPHGGTAVVLGNETYHVELVRDVATGTLTAYVLDGEMENFIRVKAASFEVVASGSAEKRVLNFRAVANAATGETVGNSSQFEAQADWLKTTATFDATLTSLEIKGTTFAAIAFNFPKGNDKD